MNINLAKRAVACKHWRWMPGMLAVGRRNMPDAWFRLEERLPKLMGEWSQALPDLADPATLGCLLAMVREAWGMPVAVWYPKNEEVCSVSVGRPHTRHLLSCSACIAWPARSARRKIPALGNSRRQGRITSTDGRIGTHETSNEKAHGAVLLRHTHTALGTIEQRQPTSLPLRQNSFQPEFPPCTFEAGPHDVFVFFMVDRTR